MIVLDVSFAVKLLNQDISINIFKPTDKFIAPDLFDYELVNVLWKTAKHKGLSSSEARNFFASLDSLDIERRKTDLMKLFLYATEMGLTAYDASYLLLAKKCRCPIATFDKQLIDVAGKENIEVMGVSLE
jgi:predicted nucleic acid-binding protein